MYCGFSFVCFCWLERLFSEQGWCMSQRWEVKSDVGSGGDGRESRVHAQARVKDRTLLSPKQSSSFSPPPNGLLLPTGRP